MMRVFCFYFLIFYCFAFKAQDKIYFLNGSVKSCKVVEISDLAVTVLSNGAKENYNKIDIALIEYKNGRTDVITLPQQEATYDPNIENVPPADPEKPFAGKINYVSLNSLALYNADVCAFYERITKNKLIGAGVMGAYNFNLRTTFPNLFLSALHNTKKNYDLGVTLNVYPTCFKNKTTFYFGALIKYTDFSFDKAVTDSVTSGGVLLTTVSYLRTNGHEFAAMLTGGSHTFINDNFYLRTLIGIGAFKLTGDFKKEFNSEINKNSTNASTYYNYNYLPKAYLGINFGFNF